MPWGSLWGHLVDFCWKCTLLSNVWKTIDLCWFFMGWRVSGGTWIVTLEGLGYTFAGWEAAGGIREASGRYLETPGRLGSGLE